MPTGPVMNEPGHTHTPPHINPTRYYETSVAYVHLAKGLCLCHRAQSSGQMWSWCHEAAERWLHNNIQHPAWAALSNRLVDILKVQTADAHQEMMTSLGLKHSDSSDRAEDLSCVKKIKALVNEKKIRSGSDKQWFKEENDWEKKTMGMIYFFIVDCLRFEKSLHLQSNWGHCFTAHPPCSLSLQMETCVPHMHPNVLFLIANSSPEIKKTKQPFLSWETC